MSGNEEFFDSAGSGESFPSVKFPEVGKSYVKGTVVTTPSPVKRPDLNDATKMVDQLPINLVLDAPCTVKDPDTKQERVAQAGETVTLWVGFGGLAGAIKEALASVGRKGVVAGMNVTAAYIEDRPGKFPIPAKVYRASILLPAETGTSVEDLFPTKAG